MFMHAMAFCNFAFNNMRLSADVYKSSRPELSAVTPYFFNTSIV